MFGLGFTEILVIAVVILIFVKPENLPGLVKKAGKSYGDFKHTMDDVQKMKEEFVKLADTDIKSALEKQVIDVASTETKAEAK